MSNLPALNRDLHMVTQKRLEVRWATWPDSWATFVETIRAEGSEAEISVINRWPDEFKVAALQRAEKIATWQENRVFEYLQKIDDLTEATKLCQKTGIEVADNITRLTALKYLVDRAMGIAKAPNDPTTPAGESLSANLDEKLRLQRTLRQTPDGTVVAEERHFGGED